MDLGEMDFEEFRRQFEARESSPPGEAEVIDVPYMRGIISGDRRLDHDAVGSDWSRPYFLARSGYMWPRDYFLAPRTDDLSTLRHLHLAPRSQQCFACRPQAVQRGALSDPWHEDGRFLFHPDTRPGWAHPSIAATKARAERARNVLAGETPNYEELDPYRFDLGPGDTIFIPATWGHEVFTTSGSISLTYNFRHLVTDNFRHARDPQVWRHRAHKFRNLIIRRRSDSPTP